MTQAQMPDTSYSPDVEIDERGRVVFARDIKPGEVFSVPLHMMKHIDKKRR